MLLPPPMAPPDSDSGASTSGASPASAIQAASTTTGPPSRSSVSPGLAENLDGKLSRPRKRGRPLAESAGYFIIDKINRKMTCRACTFCMSLQAGRYNSLLLACSKFETQHADAFQRPTTVPLEATRAPSTKPAMPSIPFRNAYDMSMSAECSEAVNVAYTEAVLASGGKIEYCTDEEEYAEF